MGEGSLTGILIYEANRKAGVGLCSMRAMIRDLVVGGGWCLSVVGTVLDVLMGRLRRLMQ